jgi:hypothetical protein
MKTYKEEENWTLWSFWERLRIPKKNEIKNKQEGDGWMTQVYRSQKRLLEVNRLNCFEKDEKDEKHHHQKPVK